MKEESTKDKIDMYDETERVFTYEYSYREETTSGYVEYISKTVLDRRFSGYGDIIRYIEKGFSPEIFWLLFNRLIGDL